MHDLARFTRNCDNYEVIKMSHVCNYRTFSKNQRKIKYLCMFLVIEYNLLLSIYLLFIGFCIGHKLNLSFGLTPFEEILICSIYEF